MRMKLHRSTNMATKATEFYVSHGPDDLELCASFPATDTGQWAANDWQTRLAHRGDVTLFDDDLGRCIIGSVAELAE